MLSKTVFLIVCVFVSLVLAQPIQSDVNDQSSSDSLHRMKRFLGFNGAYAAGRAYYEYLRDRGDFHFCGYNRVGTPVYTNGHLLLCSGNCPKDDYSCN